MGVNAFLVALLGPALEIKLHVIQGWPMNLQEEVAHATEVNAMVEAENTKTARSRGDVRVVELAEDSLEEVEKLKVELQKALADIHSSLATGSGNR